jgi:isoleucyl-tRNA synthetase
MALSFENKDKIDENKDFPALLQKVSIKHVVGFIPTCYRNFSFDKVAYKNVVSNGLVLDKNGQNV